ncbi:MAG: DUF4175 family protein [Pseudomonadota bacterium]
MADATTHVLRQLRLTRLGLWAERITRGFWPAWSALFAAVAVWAFDIGPELWRGSLIAALGLLTLVTTILGLRSFQAPSEAEARARLDETLAGRPLTALQDDQVIGQDDAASAAVWEAHQRRMAARLADARAVAPDLKVSSRDPYALRYLAVLMAALGLLFGTIWRAPEMPDLTATGQAVAAGPSWEAWLEPPRHTGLPTLYLPEIDPGAVEVPEGTRVTLRLYGDTTDLTVTETVSGRQQSDPTAPMQDFEVVQSGTLAIGVTGPVWSLTATPDATPEVRIAGEADFEHPNLITLPWEASDDFGIAAARITIALDPDAAERRHGLDVAPEPRDPVEMDMALPISGDRAEVVATFAAELVEHPLAGMPVSVTLEALDAAGQVGVTREQIVLPGRSFYDQVAGALIEQRRDLYWARDNRERVARLLRAITWKAGDRFDNPAAFLIVRMAIRRLDEGPLSVETRDEVAEMLWEAAIRLEENSLDSALERLRQAQERLSEAIRQGASEEEIARLTQEMREAMDDYTRQLAEQQGQQQQGQQQAQGEMQEITPDMLSQMMERIEELMRQGRTAEAQELLRQLQEMMENMQVTQGQGGPGQPGEGQQAMDELREQLREQQELSDEAFRELQEQFGQQGQQPQQGQQQGQEQGQQPGQQPGQQFGQGQPGQQAQPGQPGQQPGQGQQAQRPGEGSGDRPGTDAEGLAQRQEALRRGLETLRDNLPGAGTEPGEAAREALGRAEEAMREAERDLADGNLGGALDDQAHSPSHKVW